MIVILVLKLFRMFLKNNENLEKFVDYLEENKRDNKYNSFSITLWNKVFYDEYYNWVLHHYWLCFYLKKYRL